MGISSLAREITPVGMPPLAAASRACESPSTLDNSLYVGAPGCVSGGQNTSAARQQIFDHGRCDCRSLVAISAPSWFIKQHQTATASGFAVPMAGLCAVVQAAYCGRRWLDTLAPCSALYFSLVGRKRHTLIALRIVAVCLTTLQRGNLECMYTRAHVRCIARKAICDRLGVAKIGYNVLEEVDTRLSSPGARGAARGARHREAVPPIGEASPPAVILDTSMDEEPTAGPLGDKPELAASTSSSWANVGSTKSNPKVTSLGVTNSAPECSIQSIGWRAPRSITAPSSPTTGTTPPHDSPRRARARTASISAAAKTPEIISGACATVRCARAVRYRRSALATANAAACASAERARSSCGTTNAVAPERDTDTISPRALASPTLTGTTSVPSRLMGTGAAPPFRPALVALTASVRRKAAYASSKRRWAAAAAARRLPRSGKKDDESKGWGDRSRSAEDVDDGAGRVRSSSSNAPHSCVLSRGGGAAQDAIFARVGARARASTSSDQDESCANALRGRVEPLAALCALE
eukprot:scaffold40263_cov31-Tisochrysis_lutea.AAC.2